MVASTVCTLKLSSCQFGMMNVENEKAPRLEDRLHWCTLAQIVCNKFVALLRYKKAKQSTFQGQIMRKRLTEN